MKKQNQMVVKATRYAFDLMVMGKADPDIWFQMHLDFKQIRENALRSV
jgi:hypothetical protein